eukprot:g60892.t1
MQQDCWLYVIQVARQASIHRVGWVQVPGRWPTGRAVMERPDLDEVAKRLKLGVAFPAVSAVVLLLSNTPTGQAMALLPIGMLLVQFAMLMRWSAMLPLEIRYLNAQEAEQAHTFALQVRQQLTAKHRQTERNNSEEGANAPLNAASPAQNEIESAHSEQRVHSAADLNTIQTQGSNSEEGGGEQVARSSVADADRDKPDETAPQTGSCLSILLRHNFLSEASEFTRFVPLSQLTVSDKKTDQAQSQSELVSLRYGDVEHVVPKSQFIPDFQSLLLLLPSSPNKAQSA